ncbi:efflux RND transporter periplasmic adaptor subunit [Fodinibius sp.]|uniref:efflux RND transporter periplasmic adaptor subunit n=1 Tax=Fodinibius sp. TaxID=1872440 RepID=UPI002ACDAFE0|nr:efflux RND transporter periplasmic adaptor subunit [Fodinibius sp.]MDZ7657690.1 efflux RND transporter periplasmic adaptor subunit [Fodinibius sp.]
MKKKDILTVFIIAFLGTAAILWITADTSSADQQENTNQDAAVAVEITKPVVKTIADHLPYLGTVAGTKDGNLSFRIGGTLNQIYVEEGENVQQGQLLATVAVPELDAQLRRAQSELNKAKSSKAFWEREVSTDSTLYKDGAISQTVFNKTAFNYEQALSSFHAAKAALEEVRERKKQTQLHAPAKGTIGSIMIREGSNVGPNQPVFFFHQGEPTVYADVLAQDIQKGIKVGSSVTAKLSDSTITGTVERMDARAKPPFRSVRVFTSFPDNAFEGRRSGTGVTLTFEVNKQEDALLVPLSSVDLRGDQPRLFKITNQMTVEAIPVTLGIQDGELRQAEGEISHNDKIVSSGVNNVDPGDRVEIIREITLNN